jgi:hypothetical protein
MDGGTLIENLVIEIDAEIARLQHAKALLLGVSTPTKRGPGRPAKAAASPPAAAKKRTKRTVTAEAREKMRKGQLKRWAAVKKSAKKSTK